MFTIGYKIMENHAAAYIEKVPAVIDFSLMEMFVQSCCF